MNLMNGVGDLENERWLGSPVELPSASITPAAQSHQFEINANILGAI